MLRFVMFSNTIFLIFQRRTLKCASTYRCMDRKTVVTFQLRCYTSVPIARWAAEEIVRQTDSNFPLPLGSWSPAESENTKTVESWKRSAHIPHTQPMQYLLKHLVQIWFRVHPRCCSVAEKDEIGHHSNRIDGNHLAHTTEGGVFLFVIPDVSEWWTPIFIDKISKNIVHKR